MEETLCHLEYFATEGKWNVEMLFLTIEVVVSRVCDWGLGEQSYSE